MQRNCVVFFRPRTGADYCIESNQMSAKSSRRQNKIELNLVRLDGGKEVVYRPFAVKTVYISLNNSEFQMPRSYSHIIHIFSLIHKIIYSAQ